MPITLADILPGDVILTARHLFERDSLFIKFANFFNNGLAYKDWTHAALYIGNGQIVEACTDGVKTSDLQQKYINNGYEIIVLRHKNANYAQLQIAIDFCKSTTGDKYDWRGLTYFLLYNFIPLQFHFILENDFIGSMFHVSCVTSVRQDDVLRMGGSYFTKDEIYRWSKNKRAQLDNNGK